MTNDGFQSDVHTLCRKSVLKNIFYKDMQNKLLMISSLRMQDYSLDKHPTSYQLIVTPNQMNINTVTGFAHMNNHFASLVFQSRK